MIINDILIKEFSKNNKDYFIFSIKERYKLELKNNPLIRLNFEDYVSKYIDYVENNKIKYEILKLK